MGFADYLSRHPKQKPPPPSTDDTQYIINLINDFKFILTHNSLKHISATQTISDKYQTNQLAANYNKQAYNHDNAFCINPLNLQSRTFSPSVESKLNHSNSKQIHKNINLLQNISKILPQCLPQNSHYINSINSISFTSAKNYLQGYNTILVTTRSRPKHNNIRTKHHKT